MTCCYLNLSKLPSPTARGQRLYAKIKAHQRGFVTKTWTCRKGECDIIKICVTLRCGIVHGRLHVMCRIMYLRENLSKAPQKLKKKWPLVLGYSPHHHVPKHRADSRFAPSQWETALLCNDVSRWLGASLESALKAWCAFIFGHECVQWAVVVTFPYGIWCWSLLALEWTPIFTSQSIVFSLYSIVGVGVTGPPQSTNWSCRVLQAISSVMCCYWCPCLFIYGVSSICHWCFASRFWLVSIRLHSMS